MVSVHYYAPSDYTLGKEGPEHHFYFRHDTGEYYPDAKDAIDVILRGWFSEDPNYTLQSVYDSAPVFY